MEYTEAVWSLISTGGDTMDKEDHDFNVDGPTF